MPDQTQLAGMAAWLNKDTKLIVESDSTSIDVEFGEYAAAVMRREKIGELVLSDKARAGLMERLERAQAARGARLVRAAAETPLNAPAPIVSPDTVWSGDFGTLLDLCNLGVRRARFQYEQRARGYGRAHRLVHEQP